MIASVGVLVVTIVHFVGALNEFDRSLQRVTLPGTQVVELTQVGTYTVYREETAGTLSSAKGLSWQVHDISTGQELQTSRVFGSETYNFGNRSGEAIARFDVAIPTSVEVSGSYAGGNLGPGMTLAIGQNMMGSIMSGVLIMLFGIGGSVILFIGGGILVVVTGVRRYSWKADQKPAGAATFA